MQLGLILILAAVLVLSVVAVLILRELRRERGRAAVQPSSVVPLTSRIETDDPEVTLVGRHVLPQLAAVAESDDLTPSTAVTLFEPGADAEESTASKKLFIVSSAGQSDRGQSRKRNEDSILVMNERSLFVIADGMGGYAGGDIASKLAVEAIEKCFASGASPASGVVSDDPGPRPPRAHELVRAIEAANSSIRAEARRRPELDGMGSTLVGARFLENKARAFIGHIGDSRCYRFRRGNLRLLTADHTLSAKGVSGPMGSNLRRALGVADRISVDMCVDKPQPGDVYLLCSDGLNKMISDADIGTVLQRHLDDLDRAVAALIEEANRRGGRDNISIVLIGVLAAQEAA